MRLTAKQEEDAGSRELAQLRAEAKARKLARAVRLAAQGSTPAEIGRAMGVSGNLVLGWLRRAGVSYRTTQGQP